MTSPSTIALTSIHDALLQQLAEARAERTGKPIEITRRHVELSILRLGIAAMQKIYGVEFRRPEEASQS